MNTPFGESLPSRYEKIDKIGSGTYGIVYKARDKETQKLVAWKRMILDLEHEGVPSTAIREISLLREINHPNIVSLIDVMIADNKLSLFFEFIDRDLKQYLDQLGQGQLTEPATVKKIIYQIIKGISVCHRQRILHRDLKPQNILIDSKDNVKIADFGLARPFQVPIRPYTHEVVTLWYRAPEILLGSLEYSTPIDIWSLGCIFCEICTRKPLFTGDSEIDQIHRIFRVLGTPNETTWPGVSQLKEYRSTFPNWSAQDLKSIIRNLDEYGLDLLQRMVKLDPSQRITASQALKHPYFAELNSINFQGQ